MPGSREAQTPLGGEKTQSEIREAQAGIPIPWAPSCHGGSTEELGMKCWGSTGLNEAIGPLEAQELRGRLARGQDGELRLSSSGKEAWQLSGGTDGPSEGDLGCSSVGEGLSMLPKVVLDGRDSPC